METMDATRFVVVAVVICFVFVVLLFLFFVCFLRTNWKEISSRYLDVLISIVFLGIPDSAFDEASSVESGIVHRVGTIPAPSLDAVEICT